MEKKNRKKKKLRLSKFWQNITYIWTASMARRRFWMIDALFPESPDGMNLTLAVENAYQNRQRILDIGCGDKAQALIDLRNNGFENLYGIDLVPPNSIKNIELKKTDVRKIDYPGEFFDGVIYCSYVLAHLEFKDQITALEEIERIAHKGCRVYIGPLNPQSLNTSEIKENGFTDSKNPFFKFVEMKNKKTESTWELSRSFLPNMNCYSRPSLLQKILYRLVIPLYMFYIMNGRGLLNRIIPKAKIRKDFREKFPFEYYITFVK
ncbi:MAG TPA: class I SAM-dependent methyltransferase [Candidatus Dojkabacteria bacterium]|jgi:ubiquinone/menaquinone biosynthesis C-methylase UbiE